MATAMRSAEQASLEKLIETEMLTVESLHPEGLAMTQELAHRCKLGQGAVVMDLASGTGESACFLSARLGARVIGVDLSEEMIRRAQKKVRARGLQVALCRADAHSLPFPAAVFDVAICECTLCLFDKEQVLSEMTRVVKPEGHIGIHDLCWKDSAPAELQHTLAEIEGERPETLDGWIQLFRQAGLTDIIAVDKSHVIPGWMKEAKQQLGLLGQLSLALKVMRRWGLGGARRIWQSQRVFSSNQLGYCLVVGTRH